MAESDSPSEVFFCFQGAPFLYLIWPLAIDAGPMEYPVNLVDLFALFKYTSGLLVLTDTSPLHVQPEVFWPTNFQSTKDALAYLSL